MSQDSADFEENLLLFYQLHEKSKLLSLDIKAYMLAKTLYNSEFSANDVISSNQISTICHIYQKENIRSAREIAIKEDLELYEEINNKDKLITSLKNSPLLEISVTKRVAAAQFFKLKTGGKSDLPTVRRERR